MSNFNIEVDSKEVIAAFERLADTDMKKVWRSTLRKASKPLVQETKKQLILALGKIATRKSAKWGKSLRQGVKASFRKDKNTAKVHIMGDFRLKWFEKGTKKRYTKKGGYNRGFMKPINFFKKARNNKEQEVYNTIEQHLITEIIKRYEG